MSPPSAERPDDTPMVCSAPTTRQTFRIGTSTVPRTNEDANQEGFDVVGGSDGIIDNQLGHVYATVFGQLAEYAPDATAAGSDGWEIETEQCLDSGEVRVRIGSPAGSTPRAVGSIDQGTGVLHAQSGCAEVPVGAITWSGSGAPTPGWVLADQMSVALVGDGSGGLVGTVGFALDQETTAIRFATAIAPFLTVEAKLPGDTDVAGAFDLNSDGIITPAEIEAAPLFISLLAPDGVVAPTAYDEPRCTQGSDAWISFGAAVHATPM